MAELATLARPYAKAVFDIAKGAGGLDRWSRMLLLLAAAAETETVAILLNAPDVDETVKAHRLAELLGDDIDTQGKRFLNVLADAKRLPLLGEIHEQFEALKAADERSLDVEVLSAFELTSEQVDRLSETLHKRFHKTISITSEVDRSLIGGVLIRAGDIVIDNTIRGRLNKLNEALGQS